MKILRQLMLDLILRSETAAEMYVDEVLDGQGRPIAGTPLTPHEMCVTLDGSGSVSALVEVEGSHVWDDHIIEDQHRRFLNGS